MKVLAITSPEPCMAFFIFSPFKWRLKYDDWNQRQQEWNEIRHV